MSLTDVLILIGVIVGSSCLASLSIARHLGPAREPSDIERGRVNLDGVLDGLDREQLREVERFCLELRARQRAEKRTSPVAAPAIPS